MITKFTDLTDNHISTSQHSQVNFPNLSDNQSCNDYSIKNLHKSKSSFANKPKDYDIYKLENSNLKNEIKNLKHELTILKLLFKKLIDKNKNWAYNTNLSMNKNIDLINQSMPKLSNNNKELYQMITEVQSKLAEKSESIENFKKQFAENLTQKLDEYIAQIQNNLYIENWNLRKLLDIHSEAVKKVTKWEIELLNAENDINDKSNIENTQLNKDMINNNLKNLIDQAKTDTQKRVLNNQK